MAKKRAKVRRVAKRSVSINLGRIAIGVGLGVLALAGYLVYVHRSILLG